MITVRIGLGLTTLTSSNNRNSHQPQSDQDERLPGDLTTFRAEDPMQISLGADFHPFPFRGHSSPVAVIEIAVRDEKQLERT